MPEKDGHSYLINRLVKGLSSNRESARRGFSSTLTEFLRAQEDKEMAAQAVAKVKVAMKDHLMQKGSKTVRHFVDF